ncbi:hypothetical protein HIM_11394 [Hirsutella minnesotensis 3608]|uniref:EKC/KEOPS complex subunit BUD32 n=1 Tax=Hirsutella minnesotensis 3608 TaxID=1043627 RepID=A0A0F7ZJ34_9HYPO|nr:hypothetical protein HIM_11394 [Hirsutella minnesotensis 3608]
MMISDLRRIVFFGLIGLVALSASLPILERRQLPGGQIVCGTITFTDVDVNNAIAETQRINAIKPTLSKTQQKKFMYPHEYKNFEGLYSAAPPGTKYLEFPLQSGSVYSRGTNPGPHRVIMIDDDKKATEDPDSGRNHAPDNDSSGTNTPGTENRPAENPNEEPSAWGIKNPINELTGKSAQAAAFLVGCLASAENATAAENENTHSFKLLDIYDTVIQFARNNVAKISEDVAQLLDPIIYSPLHEAVDHQRQAFQKFENATDFKESLGAIMDSIKHTNIDGVVIGSTFIPEESLASVVKNVAEGVALSEQNVRGGSLKLAQFRPLVDAVIANSPDNNIWAAVFNLIADVNPSTPPPSSIAPTFKGTPIKSSSSRLADSETRDIVERELFGEIKNCTFRNVGGFWDKFFDPKSWRKEQNAMLKGILTAHDGKRWTDFPNIPDEKPVWDWLRSLEEQFLGDAPYKFHTTRTANQFKERKGQMDLFLQKPATETGSTFWYKHVLIVGEQKKSYDASRFKADFLQLTRYVRSIFADQPTRRFVHAFSLCASKMELWVFDRSGAYSSGTFDIHDEQDKFARALVGYTTMDNDVMGLDMFVERQDGRRYVTLDASGNETRVRLDKAMVRQKAIVCRGTTCYETQNGHVAKFSWASDKRKLEVEQLKLAEERCVKGVARVVAHRRITTIAAMREGLEFPKAHRFRDEAVHFEDPPSAIASANTSGHKRKSSSDNTSDNASGPKRRRSNSQKSKLVQEFNDQLSIGKAKPSLYTLGEDPWENRIYSCLVVSPAGRVISDFKTIKELLESMRDAIKAHQSLYMTGNILHRDISSNNIIITDPETADGFKGMLIDLDLAKVRDSGPSGARHQTGTMQFMAVEVLRKADHTYRHDLESFFYVLLWMCARYSWSNGFGGEEKLPKESDLRNWEIGSFRDIAKAKEGDMTVNGLERIMSEFPEALDVVKPLCLRIRKLLFPLDKDERMSFGTPAGDPGQLYKPIIAAYDEIINII